MINRLRRILRSVMEDDSAGAWQVPAQRPLKAEDAVVLPVNLDRAGRAAPRMDRRVTVAKNPKVGSGD